MRILALAFALIAVPALAADRDPPGPVKACKAAPQMAAKPERLRPQTLARQPRAEAYYTVVRVEDGCDKPVKVNEYRRGQR